jgi:hypothetical protein
MARIRIVVDYSRRVILNQGIRAYPICALKRSRSDVEAVYRDQFSSLACMNTIASFPRVGRHSSPTLGAHLLIEYAGERHKREPTKYITQLRAEFRYSTVSRPNFELPI